MNTTPFNRFSVAHETHRTSTSTFMSGTQRLVLRTPAAPPPSTSAVSLLMHNLRNAASTKKGEQ